MGKGLLSGVLSLVKQLLGRGSGTSANPQGPITVMGEQGLSGRAHRNAALMQELFHDSEDLTVRHVRRADAGSAQVFLLFLDGLVSKDQVAEHIIAPLLRPDAPDAAENVLFAADTRDVHSLQEAAGAVTLGECVLFEDGRAAGLAIDAKGWVHRPVEQPPTEPSVKGPKESFTEDLRSNVVLVRRRIRSPQLRSERFTLGRQSRTPVILLHLEGVARDEIVAEARRRLQGIDIDAVLDVNYVEELISDNPWSPFPSLDRTERADRAVANLLEGHVVVLVDGTPQALIAPTTLMGLMQSGEDYYQRYHQASFARELRWLAGFVGLLAPSLYVSILSYHHELIPTPLLFTIAAGRDGIPFPPVIEALLMEVAFELLREAGLRMPLIIGPALSIVGVLVIGDAAVRAGLVSPLMIVVVGMTAISTFALPSNDLGNTVRLLRFPLMILAGTLGLFGVFFGVMMITALLISSRSFGVPYLTPFVPVWRQGLKDAMVRAPHWMMRHRPWHIVKSNQIMRQPSGQRPAPPPSRGRDER